MPSGFFRAFTGPESGGNGVLPSDESARSNPVSAHNRCLCQSRWVIWLIGLTIQLKRGGLAVKRFFVSLGQVLGKILAAWLGLLQWVSGRPRVFVGWLWTS